MVIPMDPDFWDGSTGIGICCLPVEASLRLWFDQGLGKDFRAGLAKPFCSSYTKGLSSQRSDFWDNPELLVEIARKLGCSRQKLRQPKANDSMW